MRMQHVNNSKLWRENYRIPLLGRTIFNAFELERSQFNFNFCLHRLLLTVIEVESPRKLVNEFSSEVAHDREQPFYLLLAHRFIIRITRAGFLRFDHGEAAEKAEQSE